MNWRTLISDYEAVRYSPADVALCLLAVVDEDNVEAVMRHLPDEVADLVLRLVLNYSGTKTIVIGTSRQPTEHNIAIARNWLFKQGRLQG